MRRLRPAGCRRLEDIGHVVDADLPGLLRRVPGGTEERRLLIVAKSAKRRAASRARRYAAIWRFMRSGSLARPLERLRELMGAEAARPVGDNFRLLRFAGVIERMFVLAPDGRESSPRSTPPSASFGATPVRPSPSHGGSCSASAWQSSPPSWCVSCWSTRSPTPTTPGPVRRSRCSCSTTVSRSPSLAGARPCSTAPGRPRDARRIAEDRTLPSCRKSTLDEAPAYRATCSAASDRHRATRQRAASDRCRR